MFAQIARQLAPGGLVIFGELHGTMEVPAFVANAAEFAAGRGPVTVALELPDELQPGIDAFLAAKDDETGRAALIATPSAFWEWRDGRGGDGLVVLLARLRAIGARVVSIDGAWPSAEARDLGMARSLLSAQRPDHTTIVVCGNLHARTDNRRWMGWHVRQARPALISLDLGHAGGRAYVATSDGNGVHEQQARWLGEPGVSLFAERHACGWDGTFFVGSITPSMPLVR
jgi:hypothetical protein